MRRNSFVARVTRVSFAALSRKIVSSETPPSSRSKEHSATARVTAGVPNCTRRPRFGTRLRNPSGVSPNRKMNHLSAFQCLDQGVKSFGLGFRPHLFQFSFSCRKQDCQRARTLNLSDYLFLKRVTAEQNNTCLDSCLRQRVKQCVFRQLGHREIDTSILKCTILPGCCVRAFCTRTSRRPGSLS